MKIALYSALFLAVVFVALNLVVIIYGNSFVMSQEEAKDIDGVDCIIVLGAAVYEDGSMSSVLTERVNMGKSLYENGVSPKILLSGDHSRQDYDEVNAMKNHLLDGGIQREVIFTDHAGFDTYDSMYRAKEIFKAEKVVIVTQKFHLSRAVFIARSLGLEAYGVASDVDYRYLKPKTELRECFARAKYVFDAIFKPKPEYLGEAIPIWGEASLSDG